MVNKVFLIGTLGITPELRETAAGISYCNISIATSESFKNRESGEWETKTEWHRVSIWGRQAETVCKYLRKGRKVYVEGKMQTRSWEHQGQTHWRTAVVASKVMFLDSPAKGRKKSTQSESGKPGKKTVQTEQHLPPPDADSDNDIDSNVEEFDDLPW